MQAKTIERNPRWAFDAKIDHWFVQGYVRQGDAAKINIDGLPIIPSHHANKALNVGERAGVWLQQTDDGRMQVDHWHDQLSRPDHHSEQPLDDAGTVDVSRHHQHEAAGDDLPSAGQLGGESRSFKPERATSQRIEWDRPALSPQEIQRPDIDNRPASLRPDIERPDIDKPILSRPESHRPQIDRPSLPHLDVHRPELTRPR